LTNRAISWPDEVASYAGIFQPACGGIP